MKSVGIVLAAGASTRMGSPKSLLAGPDGIPLVVKQADLLKAGGCSSVAVVLGSDVERIRGQLPEALETIENPRWAEGRATSLQAAVAVRPRTDGWLFMPVDAIGVQISTIQLIWRTVAQDPALVWRPVHHGAKGNLLWLPRKVRQDLMQLPPAARVDEWVQPLANEVEVDDPAILRNVNTPEDWAAWLQESPDG
jgi:CTP:molybdopterin cytidylyltransferase MocA